MLAYAKLSSCRSFGMGMGPIPMTAVWQWEDRNGIVDPELRRHVEAVFTAVDATTVQRANRPSGGGKQES